MKYRLNILKEHNLGLKEIQETISKIDPLPGAKEFLDKLREMTQVIIISDTFSQFAALQSIGYDSIASGDSHNDLGMIQASKAGFLFKSTDAIKSEYPEIPAYETYDELYDAIKKVIEG